ncbi:MAG: hypothetical protein HZC39_13460 [Chloroflexi bacterium]|jgi:hypothetical protein|nr:hypothetical protein [Chloroflexota bacterium]MBI5704535.1 hypothetical protein [Chloroflexota bacterium]GER78891.1 conserved hypothetical protein [Candidatus Denitrolinea symbiosum]
MAFYLGRRGPDDLVLFRSSTIPTKESHGHLYTAVIGPFKSKVGASYFARYGRNNPHIRTADDAERLARADPRMEQAIVEESMTDEELAIALECDAQDQAEYSPQLNLPFQSRQEFFQTQGAISCPTGARTN